jgi:CRP/FNR family transcriptional regulator, cyclic AMP receptor protein
MSNGKMPPSSLDNNLLFSGLAYEERISLNAHVRVIKFGKHDTVYEPNMVANKAYVLLKGTIKITIHAERKDIIKYIVRPDMLFGESFLTGELLRRDYAFVLEEDTEVAEIDAHFFSTLARNNSAFAFNLLRFLGERLRYVENQLEKVVLKDSKSRIMEYLHQMGTEQGKQVGMETLVKHNMTHQDIADHTGTSRQMVTAVLNQLKRDNLLYFNRKKILFRDLNALPVAS